MFRLITLYLLEKYRRYSVFRRHIQEEENNNVTYYLKGDDGEPMKVVLPGVNARRDPLKDIHNAYLKLEKQGEECVIKGIMLDTDWVEIKSEN